MTEIVPFPSIPAHARAPSRSPRAALLRRLADVLCLPASRVNVFERSMTADLLVEMLREASVEDRARVARRVADLTDIPATLVRQLLRDEFEVAKPLLQGRISLNDPDLLDCANRCGIDHRRLIAERREVSEVVCEALVEPLEPAVIEALLRNNLARLSEPTVENLVAAAYRTPRLVTLLLRRPELRPSHAYILFWWADADARRNILRRFAVSREVLQEAASDLFFVEPLDGHRDSLSDKALQFIERRQRDHDATEMSSFASLDEAIAAAEGGLTRETTEEIARLSGLTPMTGAKIITDPGGEPIAILCKATGLPKTAIHALWRGLKRPQTDALDRVLTTYDMIGVDRAQTVLRYWNWSFLSTALTPALLRAIHDGDNDLSEAFSFPQRAAMLAFSSDFAR